MRPSAMNSVTSLARAGFFPISTCGKLGEFTGMWSRDFPSESALLQRRGHVDNNPLAPINNLHMPAHSV